DGAVFALTRAKHGVQARTEDYYEHDMAAKDEFVSLWRSDRPFIIRSFLGRLRDSLAGTTKTSVDSVPWLSNLVYRLACLACFAEARPGRSGSPPAACTSSTPP